MVLYYMFTIYETIVIVLYIEHWTLLLINCSKNQSSKRIISYLSIIKFHFGIDAATFHIEPLLFFSFGFYVFQIFHKRSFIFQWIIFEYVSDKRTTSQADHPGSRRFISISNFLEILYFIVLFWFVIHILYFILVFLNNFCKLHVFDQENFKF